MATSCLVCTGPVTQFLDLGRQPLSDAFPAPGDDLSREYFFRLALGQCSTCTMVQLLEVPPAERMFHQTYPYRSAGSAVMREHFARVAELLLDGRTDPFVVEIGSNDGTFLRTAAERGVRHLGVDPSGDAALEAAARGVRVRVDFFTEPLARHVLAEHGPADVVFSANTVSHDPNVNSILRGVAALLAPDGVFVFEDPYLGSVLANTAFDQIIDEHVLFFSARSVVGLLHRAGLELVDVERLPVHGGQIRFTAAHTGARPAAAAVDELLAEEDALGVHRMSRLREFAARTADRRRALVALLRRLRAEGARVVGYGATAKSATVANYCGLGPELVSAVIDATPAKQGRLTPGTHIPVLPPEAFGPGTADYALLFAWNHAEEIMAKERAFAEAGGRWVRYVPEVSVD
ncbi:class I SAM-dependent methyltransferase [Goodfellowiella coeruleoviolacea]|uniref:Methylation protein EvaC n=1 Tax=Goodfellowiella coeruleoviolacea TaxID=334858 RepID=A0AAE3GGC2_9PSEU|nr:class I SAM-dependent methyltransferase [Goodfellowiella coeruleoviolacea]MCP2167747.1 methylation protein EvaC [Goodfellowiella coeruleoviolacea]